MPIPQYRPFSLAEGLGLGLESRRDAMAHAIARQRAEQDRIRQLQEAEEAKERIKLGYSELGERTAGRVGDERIRGRTLEEQMRSNQAGEELSGRRVGIEGFTASEQAADARRRAGLEERKFGASDALSQREMGLKERTAVSEQALQTRQQELRERAQTAAEQQALRQEAIEGRKLSMQEKDTLFRNELAKQELAERKRSAEAGEGFRSQEIAETGRSNRAGEGIRGRELEQRGQQFGQELGLKTRAQEAQERQFGQNLGFQEKELTQKGQQFGQSLGLQREELTQKGQQFGQEMGLRTRQQVETERQGRTSDQRATRALSLQERQQQFFELDRNLKRAVESQTISFEQAKSLRDEAYKASLNGQDLAKWLYEKQQAAQQHGTEQATSRRGQDINAETSRYSTDTEQATSRRGQDINAETSRYSTDVAYEQAMNKPAGGSALSPEEWDRREATRERVGDERLAATINAAGQRQKAGFGQQNISREDRQKYNTIRDKERNNQRLSASELEFKRQMELAGVRDDWIDARSDANRQAGTAQDQIQNLDDALKETRALKDSDTVAEKDMYGRTIGYFDPAYGRQLEERYNRLQAQRDALAAQQLQATTRPAVQGRPTGPAMKAPGGPGSFVGKPAAPEADPYGFSDLSDVKVDQLAKTALNRNVRQAAAQWMALKRGRRG